MLATPRTRDRAAARRAGRPRAVLLLALAALAALSLAGPRAAALDGDREETTRFLWSRYGSGQYAEAAEAARAVLEEDPDAEDAIDVLASALEAVGEEEEAAKELAALAAGPPTRTAALLRLGEHLLGRGDAEAAIPRLRAALEGEGRAVRARSALGRALLDLGRRDEAGEELRLLFRAYQAAPIESLDTRDWVALAEGALAAERVPALAKEHIRPFAVEARDLLQRAFERDKDQPDTLVRWGRLYLEKWDLPEARRLAKEALKKNARHAGAHALHAEALLGDFYGGTGRYDEARREIEAALATDPGCPEAHVLRAELLLSDGLFAAASEAAGRALARRPFFPRALAVQAGVRALEGAEDPAAAAERVRHARGTHAAAQVLAALSDFFDGRFQYRRAFEVARRAVDVDQGCLPAQRQLGFAAMRVGEEALARETLERVHEADPFDLFSYNQLKLLEVMEKEFETERTERFVIRLHRSEAAAMRPYLRRLLDRSWGELSARYGVALDTPIVVEVFPNLQDFSVRAVAHRFIPASGVTFARVVALASPAAFPPGTHGWGRVLWHELAHVATLERSAYRVPRWLTEGLSVFEESKGHPAWVREWDVDLVDALARDRLLPIEELNQGFSKPRFPNQVMLSYYQGGLICQFIDETWGFPALLALLDGYREGLPLEKNLARALGGVAPAEFDRRFLAYARAQFAGIPYRAPCLDDTELASHRRAARSRPRDQDACARYALAAADRRRTADAEAAALALEKLDPGSGDALLVHALVAVARGEPDRAVELAAEARAAGTRDPLLAEEVLFQAYAKRDPKTKQRRDLRRAILSAETARGLFPRNPGYEERLIGLYAEAKLEEKRVEALRRVAALEPDNIVARVELSTLAREAKSDEEAERWLEEMLWLDPRPPDLHLELAHVRLRRKDHLGAREEIESFLRLAPDDARAAAIEAALAEAGHPVRRERARGAAGEAPGTTTPTAAPSPAAPAPPTPSAAPRQEAF
jgi:tetratricopeptide (TPR) repeat protein